MKRYDLVTNYRCGSSIEEMEEAEEYGDWVKWEDVCPLLKIAEETIVGLADQQAYPHDWWRPAYERIKAALN